MATKVIKFNDGINTYVPVTVASAVQYSYNGGVMSVQDALGTVVSAVIPAAGHFGATVNLTYSDGVFDIANVNEPNLNINISGINITAAFTNTTLNSLVANGTEMNLALENDARLEQTVGEKHTRDFIVTVVQAFMNQ